MMTTSAPKDLRPSDLVEIGMRSLYSTSMRAPPLSTVHNVRQRSLALVIARVSDPADRMHDDMFVLVSGAVGWSWCPGVICAERTIANDEADVRLIVRGSER